ncbi:mutS protein homolog 4 [Nilaparvata lugens]|uniref:mutS protein homolog 4 n=1 Tax=Nilaparvata lugens TaxID=108931 RepID=UPI00193D784B|nr:mutS protein homolog 4 [Nilaparvata lugens]
MFQPPSIDGRSINSSRHRTAMSASNENKKPFKLSVDKIAFPSTFSETPHSFDFDDKKDEAKSIFETMPTGNSSRRTSMAGSCTFKVPRIVQSNRSINTNDSFIGDLSISKFVSSPNHRFNYTPSESIFKGVMNTQMIDRPSLNGSATNLTNIAQQEIQDSSESIYKTPTRSGSIAQQQDIQDIRELVTRPGFTQNDCRTPQRNQQIPIISISPERELIYNETPLQESENIIVPNPLFPDVKRRRIVDDSIQHFRPSSSSNLHTATEPAGRFRNYQDDYEPEINPTTSTVFQRISASSEREISMTPKQADIEVTGIFQGSSTDSRIKSIMKDTRQKMSLFTPIDKCRNSKTPTPVRFRENTIQGNNNSGSEMTSGFLRTSTVNNFIPDFRCSPEGGVQYTPKPADKSIKGLFPLSSFSDSVKASNPSSSKSTKEEMPSLVNSSDKHRTPTCLSDRQRTPKSSSDQQRTPRSAATSEDSTHNTILAVTEGRGLARGEVGIAVMDTKRPQLVLCQITDVQTYINTLAKVQIFNPVEILVPSTFAENTQAESLFSKINDHFPQVNLTSVQRRYFSEREGLNLVQRLCLEDYSTIELIIKNKFYALAALSALITFIEHSHSMVFTKKSLKILYQNAEEVMSIDLDTAKRLELVFSATGDNMHKSLLSVFNYCNTLSGRRFLRANILQPPCNLKVIEKRLECVNELVHDAMLITNLKVELRNFNDVEQLLWFCTQAPTLSSTKISELQMNYILLLHMTMKSLPAMQECLRETKSERFCKFKEVLNDDRFKLILENLKTYINEDARPAKGFMPSQQQRCFAIKPGVNGLLDVARNTYSKLIDQTTDVVKKLSEDHDLPLKWHSSFAKGIHIVLNLSKNKQFKLKDLPAVFIQATRTRQSITCTTEELLVLNQRMKSCLQEIQLMSNVVLNELVQEIQKYIGCIYKLCEVIAELDMLVCFGVVSSSSDFVSPIFGSRLDLKSSRHPILDVVSSSSPVSNDVSASSEKNFHVITGPNMGGKSIYIRQIALLQIIAQMGCFVPAAYAEFRVMECVLSRIGFDDSIEHNASTFSMEMRQINYILQILATDRRCLVIIDELCRGTSSEEGVAIAWAVCERLAETSAFTYVTTHFQLLTTMQNVHPNVSNWHFEAEELSDERLRFTHKLLPGISTVANYGIKLARMVALPESVLKDIILLKNKLNQDYQGMMIDTVQGEEPDELVQTIVVKIIDRIISTKSKEGLIGDLKEIMNSTDEDRDGTVHVRELEDRSSATQIRERLIFNESTGIISWTQEKNEMKTIVSLWIRMKSRSSLN